MEIYQVNIQELKTRFEKGLLQVSSILGKPIERISRDKYYQTCYDNNIKCVNPHLIGGYRNARAEMLHNLDSSVLTNPITTNVEKVEDDFYNEEAFPTREFLQEEVKKYKKFVITTAVAKKKVNVDFLNSLKNYADRNNALILILPSDIGNSKSKDSKVVELDKKLKDISVVYKDIYLNDNLCVCSIKTSAKQLKTLRGLDRIATKKNASIIVGSTKLFENNVPTQNGNIPLRILTTGAITENNYDTDKYMSKRTAYLAEEDHTYGAVVVEIVDNTFFHMRLVEGSANNTFTDLGIEYKPDGSVTELFDTVAIFGDSHTERINKDLHNTLMDMTKKMHIDTVVLHDVFNGTSITHHDKGKALTKAIKANEDRHSLEKEGECLKAYLEDIKKHVRDIVIVKSNHDRHLDSYLEEGRYINDPVNTYVGHKLAIAYMDGEDPLRYLIENLLGLDPKCARWLKLDEKYKKYGVELSQHGSEGCCGSKGSLMQFEKGIGNCVTAHTHSAQRLRKACCVGTISELDQVYNRGGLTTWSLTICLLYSNSTKQLIHFIPDKKGNYRYTL